MSLLLLCCVIFFIWLILRYQRMSVLSRHGIPGPKPNLLLGNSIDYFTKGCVDCFTEWTRKYGPIVGFYLGGTPHVLVTDTELLKLVQVKDFHLFSQRPSMV